VLRWFMMRGVYWTPYWLYAIGTLLVVSCVWEKGREARQKLGLFAWFCATVILIVLVLWGDRLV